MFPISSIFSSTVSITSEQSLSATIYGVKTIDSSIERTCSSSITSQLSADTISLITTFRSFDTPESFISHPSWAKTSTRSCVKGRTLCVKDAGSCGNPTTVRLSESSVAYFFWNDPPQMEIELFFISLLVSFGVVVRFVRVLRFQIILNLDARTLRAK